MKKDSYLDLIFIFLCALLFGIAMYLMLSFGTTVYLDTVIVPFIVKLIPIFCITAITISCIKEKKYYTLKLCIDIIMVCFIIYYYVFD